MSTGISTPEPEWAGLVTPEDLRVYELAGFGQPGQLGDRPALLIIDIQYRTVGPTRAPIETAIREQYRTACGEYGWQAIDRLVPVLQQARDSKVPVIYAYVAPKKPGTLGRLGDKVPAIADIDAKGYEFVAEIAPVEGDVLIPKKHPSAFFATPLLSELIDRRIDTLLVAGATTSGCVRATVTDAFSMNFRVGVIRDAVFDRGQVSHRVNLFDMASKYCELLTADAAVSYLRKTGRR
jgi:nicotinamidase-related amidase